jgi:hypothetical protein
MKNILRVKTILSLALIMLFMGLAIGDTLAASKKTSLEIRARVLPFAEYSILHQEGSLVVTQADIDRGYVDIQRAMVFSMKTNNVNGYMLGFFVDSGPFSGITVFDGSSTHMLSGSGGEVMMPYEGMHSVTKELNVRVHLAADAQPDTYQWPVALMINII